MIKEIPTRKIKAKHQKCKYRLIIKKNNIHIPFQDKVFSLPVFNVLHSS